MKIVIAASYGPSLIKFRGNLIKKWVSRGHDVVCISIEPAEEMAEQIKQLGASYYCVAGDRTGTSVFGGFKMISDYKKAFDEIKPDLVFLYMSKPIAFGGIAAIQCKIKRIAVFQTGLEIAFYSKGLKNYLLRILLKTIYKYVQKHCETVFFMCHEDERKMLEWGLVKKEQVCYVDGSGVDMSHFVKSKLPEAPIVLMIARLVWSKGIREYIEAAKIIKPKYPNAEFLLVGGMDENSEALKQDEIDLLQKEKIIKYYGYQDDVRPYLDMCSIFVLPSYHEGKGTSILEAQAVGRPVITTTAPGCSETVIDGYNGYLVPPKDGKALAEKILNLVENAAKREEMAENAYAFCKKTFDVNIINNNICERLEIK